MRKDPQSLTLNLNYFRVCDDKLTCQDHPEQNIHMVHIHTLSVIIPLARAEGGSGRGNDFLVGSFEALEEEADGKQHGKHCHKGVPPLGDRSTTDSNSDVDVACRDIFVKI